MTISQANRINGFEHSVTRRGRTFIAMALGKVSPNATVKILAEARTEKDALKLVVEKVYRYNKSLVARRANGRCENCGQSSLTGEAHHKVHRGMGGGNRNDREENLIWLGSNCGCHRIEHGENRGF